MLALLITVLADFSSRILLPILVALITYYLISKRDELKQRRRTSRLGVAVIESLLEEVRNGVSIFTDISKYDLSKHDYSKRPLPRKSWNGMQTISDEILLRIIEVSKGIKPYSYPPNQIRIHCKNYFDHMAINLDNCLLTQSYHWIICAKKLAVDSKYLEAAKGVQNMLEQTKKLLESNSKKLFPK